MTFIEKAKKVAKTFRGNSNIERVKVGIPTSLAEVVTYFTTKANLIAEGELKGTWIVPNTDKKGLAKGLNFAYRPRVVRARVGITQVGNTKEQVAFKTRQEAIAFMLEHAQALKEGDEAVVACFEKALQTCSEQDLGCLAKAS